MPQEMRRSCEGEGRGCGRKSGVGGKGCVHMKQVGFDNVWVNLWPEWRRPPCSTQDSKGPTAHKPRGFFTRENRCQLLT